MKILLIEDDLKLNKLLTRFLAKKYEVVSAFRLEEARQFLDDVDVVVSDIVLPDGEAVSLLSELRRSGVEIPFIFMTAYASIGSAIQALKAGATDYLIKPVEPDVLLKVLEKIEREKQLLSQREILNEQLTKFNLFYKSKFMRDLINKIKDYAKEDINILITGPTGVGKGLIARLIHKLSGKKVLVEINCTAIPESLFESELFGYKKGAFTGADKNKKGLVEQAENGTLILDEIGEIPLSVQPKLLKFVEEGTFIRLGDTKVKKVNTRILALTNRDLEEEVRKGNFREDLYFRLSTFKLEILPLKSRKEDIEAIVEGYLPIYNKKYQKNLQITQEIMEKLKAYEWPGNVRQLISYIERSVIANKWLDLDVENSDIKLEGALKKLEEEKEKKEVEIIKLALKKYPNYSLTKLAKLLGVTRRQLEFRMKKYGL